MAANTTVVTLFPTVSSETITANAASVSLSKKNKIRELKWFYKKLKNM